MALIKRKAKIKRAQIYDQKQREKEKAREEAEDELFVFGYAAKLFKDDKKATEIDRGEHLIPWMGDKNFQIDRYDGRGHLHNLSEFDRDSWNKIHNLSEEETRIEALCDEERYLALNTDLFEEKNRHEEEIKRLNEAIAASETSYSAISFNYDESKPNQSDTYDPMQPTQDEADIETRQIEEKVTVKSINVVLEEPFMAPAELKIPMDMEVPETIKMHAFIERTANFISSRGAQMEIRIKANQAGNSQFDFLNFEHYLNPYYKHLLKLIKSGHYTPIVDKRKTQDKSHTKEGKDVCNIRTTGNDDSGHHSEDDDDDDQDHSGYLHPSLLSNPRPKPTSISAIHQPSSQPVSDTHRLPPTHSSVHPAIYEIPAGYHDITCLLAQGYDPAALVAAGYLPSVIGSLIPPPPPPPSSNSDHGAQIQPYISVAQGTPFTPPPPPPAPPPPPVSNVNLVHTEISTSIIPTPAIYPPPPVSDVSGTSSPSAIPSGADNSNIIPPTPDIQPIIDKMAKYVARNGEEFEATVRAKNDSRFEFLLPWHSFYTYYKYKKNVFLEEFRKGDENEDDKPKKAPISFSIKTKESEEKLLDRPSALPYESSESDDENDQKEPKTKKVNLLPGKTPPCATVPDDAVPTPMIVDEQEEILSRHVEKEKLERAELKQVEANRVMARQKIADKLAQAARGKLQQSSKERNVQMERRKKAALFLTMIKDKQVTMVPEGILDQVSSTKEPSKRGLSPKPRRSSNHSRSVSPVRTRSPSNTVKTSKSRETSPVRKKKRSRSKSPVRHLKSPSSRSYKVAFNRHAKKDKVNHRSRSPSPLRVRRSSPFRRSGSVGSSVTSKSKAGSKSPTFSIQTSTTIKHTSPVIPQLQKAASPTPTPMPMPTQTSTSEASSQSDKTDKTNKLREKIRAMLAMTREIGINKDS